MSAETGTARASTVAPTGTPRLAASRPLITHHPSLITRFARNRVAVLAAAFLLLAVAGAIFAPLIARNPPERILGARLASPSERFPLGTDQSGRDVFARLLYGGQVSLMVGFLAAGLS